MRKLFLGLLLLVLAVIVIGLVVAVFYEVPAPVVMMEKPIPNDRLKPQ